MGATWAGKTVVTADGARITLGEMAICDAVRKAGEPDDVTVWYWVGEQVAEWTGGPGGSEGLADVDAIPPAARRALKLARKQNARMDARRG